jgi:hypothetical protein
MKTALAGVVVGVLMLGGVEFGRIVAQATPDAGRPLDELAWLVGTWKGPGRTPDGRPATNTFRFEWAPGRNAFRYTIDRTADGTTEPAVVGLCAWHPAKKRFVLLEVGGTGDVTESVLTVSGGNYAYEETIYGRDGSTLPIRAEAVREGDDAFVFRARMEQHGEWKVVFETTWRRVRP